MTNYNTLLVSPSFLAGFTEVFPGKNSLALQREGKLPTGKHLTGNITESLAITNWLIAAHRCRDGDFTGSVEIGEGATSYNIPVYSNEPSTITLEAKVDYKWRASRTTVVNDYCVPVNPDTTPKLYKATGIGSPPHQTGSTEPTWPTSGTVADGDTTWTFISVLPDRPLALGPKIPA